MSEQTTSAVRPAGRARGDPLDRRHQAGGAAVARVLRVVHAHRARQVQQRPARTTRRACCDRRRSRCRRRACPIDARVDRAAASSRAARRWPRARRCPRRVRRPPSRARRGPACTSPGPRRARAPDLPGARSARQRQARASMPTDSSCVRFSPQAEARARAGRPERVNGHGPPRRHAGGTGSGPSRLLEWRQERGARPVNSRSPCPRRARRRCASRRA